MRIYKEDNPLDSTFIHPENYPKIESWATQNNVKLHQLVEDKDLIKKLESDKNFSDTVGEFTHKDIITSLRAPSQDPRSEFKSIEFRDDTFPVHSENETKFFRYCRGVLSLDEIELNPINLIATPHLSRYKIDAKGLDFRDKYDVRPAISWMKKNIRNAVIS